MLVHNDSTKDNIPWYWTMFGCLIGAQSKSGNAAVQEEAAK